MKLSESERKMVERFRRRRMFLIRWRWPLAILHSLCIVACVVLLNVVLRHGGSDPIDLIMPLYILTPLFFVMAINVGCLGHVINNWNGNPTTHLLLRLLEDGESD
jgi:hypothetical protein